MAVRDVDVVVACAEHELEGGQAQKEQADDRVVFGRLWFDIGFCQSVAFVGVYSWQGHGIVE